MPPATPLYTRDQVFNLVKSFSGQSNVIAVPRIFITLTGSASLALLLSQLLFWTERTTRPDGFIFKSDQDWKDEVGVTPYAVSKFKTLPYIETKVKRANGSPTTHYRLLFDSLVDQLMALLEMESSNSEDPSLETAESTSRNQEIHSSISKDPFGEFNETLTKITTKNTAKNTTKKVNPKGLAQVCAPFEPEPSTSVSKPKRQSKPKAEPSPLQYPMMQAIAKVTRSNIKIRDMAARIGKVAAQLLAAGFTPEDVLNFESYWKENDWRWEKSRMLPRPSDIVSLIEQSKSSTSYEPTIEERRAAALKELEDYRKQLEQNAAIQTGGSEEVENAAL